MPAVNPSAVLEMSEGLVKAAKQEAKRGKQKRTGKRQNMRCVGGMQWEDPTLEEWDPSEFWWAVVGSCGSGGQWWQQWAVVGCGGLWWAVVGSSGLWWAVVGCGGLWWVQTVA